MDDRLYNTSQTLSSITSTSPPFRNLLTSHPHVLNTRALLFRKHLSQVPLWQASEEHEKVGGLVGCVWETYHHPIPTATLAADEEGRARKGDADGIIVTLDYERVSYRFWLLSNGSVDAVHGILAPEGGLQDKNAKKRTLPWARTGPNAGKGRDASDRDLPLLLSKASASVSKRFATYLEEAFGVIVTPLRVDSNWLARRLEAYVGGLSDHLHDISMQSNIAELGLLKDTIGTLKLTVSVTESEVAKSLRTIDIDVPSQTLHQLLQSSAADAQSPNSSSTISDSANSTPDPSATFLSALQHHIENRTGLILPLTGSPATLNSGPLRLTRISCSAFALSTEGRIKFSSKAVEALDVPEINRMLQELADGDDGDVNMDDTNIDEVELADVLRTWTQGRRGSSEGSGASQSRPRSRARKAGAGGKPSAVAGVNMVRRQNMYLLEELVREGMKRA
jgi:hypothetical protein